MRRPLFGLITTHVAYTQGDILLSKMVKLTDDYEYTFMRVTVRTGGHLLLELVPRARNNGSLPDWKFRPAIEGTHVHTQDFGD